MIDSQSPPGAYRAALAPNIRCARCHQSVCGHDDLTYQGLLPAPATSVQAADADPAAVLSAADARRARRGYPRSFASPASTVVPLPHGVRS